MATSDHSETEDDYCETKNERDSETEDDDPRKHSSSKRGREEEVETCNPKINEESKKLKKMAFHWNWRDECTILENFYEFAGKNGSYSKEFYHFLKNKLSVEVSNSQLSDKVYRLRKRFLKDKCKMEEGKITKFSNANYEKLFEMSSNIWGDSDKSPKSRSLIMQSSQWKGEAVDGFDEKMFKKLVENIKLDITCIPPNVLTDLRKDWEDVKTAKHEYELKNAKLLVEISDIRYSQNKRCHTFLNF